MSHSPAQFAQMLQQQGSRYQACSAIDQDCVHVRFPGVFQEQGVIWDARLLTLRHEYELQSSPEPQAIARNFRQYIEISAGEDNLVPITVALNVPQFDEPTILKTIIMIHNYKRLRLGRHEFGEPVRFSD